MTNIEILLEKYFEGQTSLDEEKFLRNYFLQADLPESMETYRPMFSFFTGQIEGEKIPDQPVLHPEISGKNKTGRFRKQLLTIGISGLAAGILLFFGIRGLTERSHKVSYSESSVYISGVKHIDEKSVNTEVLRALENISETNDDLFGSQINLLNDFNDL